MRTFKKIILIFFIFQCFGVWQLAAAIQLAPGLLLYDDVSGSDHEFLKTVIRQLDRYARKADIRRARKETVTIICGKGNFFGFYRDDQLYLPQTALQWQEDHALRCKVYAALAAWRFNFKLPSGTNGLAEWMTCGIDAEIAAAAGSGKFIAANRAYPLLMEFFGYCGALPDYAAMCRAGHSNDRVLHDFLAEQARMLLTILADNSKIGEIFQRTAEGGAPDCFLELYASADDANEKLAAETMTRLWNRYRPLPAELALFRLEELDIIFIQQADDDGKPTGDYIECNWRKLAKMLETPRLDAENIRNDLSGKYSAFGKLLADNERFFCNAAAAAIKEFGNYDDAVDRFAEHLENLKNALRKRSKTDRFMRDTLLRSTPLPDNFARLFDAAEVPNSAASDDELRFLQKVLNDYLR